MYLPTSGTAEVVSNLSPPVDIVVHVATNYGRAFNPLTEVVESNITFPLQVLRGAIRNGARLFINTDSYFNKDGFSYFALPDYSLTKKAFLEWLKFDSKNIRTVNMRLEHVYGPHDTASKFVPTLLDAISNSDVDEIALTLGTQERDFIWVDDVVEAYLLVIAELDTEESKSFREYEIGTGVSTQISEVSLALKELMSSSIDLKFGSLEMRDDEIMKSVSNKAFQNDFNWHPRVPLREGLARLVEAEEQARAAQE